MNFETAFAHYQAHTATAEETALVERELAKYQLIEDYFANKGSTVPTDDRLDEEYLLEEAMTDDEIDEDFNQQE